jgi:hypothetical protein
MRRYKTYKGKSSWSGRVTMKSEAVLFITFKYKAVQEPGLKSIKRKVLVQKRKLKPNYIYQMKMKDHNNIYYLPTISALLDSAQNYHVCIRYHRTNVHHFFST